MRNLDQNEGGGCLQCANRTTISSPYLSQVPTGMFSELADTFSGGSDL